MADLTTEAVVSTGLDATANAANAGGDTFEYGATIRVENGDATSTDVTMVTPQVEDTDLAVDDRVVTVPAGEARYMKATDRAYLDTETGRVSLTYEKVTSLTVEVIQ